MLAGFSFLSRVSKYICERFEIFDVSSENWVELEEEKEKKQEKLEKLGKAGDNTHIEIQNVNNKPNTDNIVSDKSQNNSNSPLHK